MRPTLIYNSHLLQFPELLSVFSSKISGNSLNKFNLSLSVNLDKSLTIENRKSLFENLNIPEENIVWEYQTHSTNISYVDKPCFIDNNDGLITDKRNLYLIVTIADCIPIHIYDKNKKIIASLHSGWRGTKDRILHKCILKLIDDFRSNPKDLYFYFGPSICKNHFEVDEDVSQLFDEKYVFPRNKKFLIDLIKINHDILQEFNVPDNNIMTSRLCTYSSNTFLHSYRREKEKSGRLLGVLGIKG